MTRKVFLPFFALAILVAGCGKSGEAETPLLNQPEEPKVSTETPTTSTTPVAKELTVGMDLVQVKEIKGAPDDTRHEHGPAGQEYDFWIWKDVQIKIENGKVIKVEPR